VTILIFGYPAISLGQLNQAVFVGAGDIAGCGGKQGNATAKFGTIKTNSEVRNNVAHGVLKLTLNPTSYDWEFIPVAGQTFSDRGTASCHSRNH